MFRSLRLIILVFVLPLLIVACASINESVDSGALPGLRLQTGSYELTGIVLSADTMNPIEGAEISTGKSGFSITKSDSLGVFVLKMRGYVQQMGVKQLLFSKRGFETKMLNTSRTNVGTIVLRKDEQ